MKLTNESATYQAVTANLNSEALLLGRTQVSYTHKSIQIIPQIIRIIHLC